MDESVRELIDGAYDLHIHTSPSHAKRARRAKRMRFASS